MAQDAKDFNQPEDVASEPLRTWKMDTMARSAPIGDVAGGEVDEVHQYDAPYEGRASLRKGPVNATGESGKNKA